MPGLARVHDSIAHSLAPAGVLIGAVGGALLGRSLAAAALGARVGRFLGNLITMGAGEITTGCCDVMVDGLYLACAVLDRAKCSGLPLVPFSDHGFQRIATGVTSVFANNRPVATEGDKIQCGATITSGSSTVITDASHDSYMAVNSEMPPVFDLGLFIASMGTWGGRAYGVIALLDEERRRNMLRFLFQKDAFTQDLARIADTLLAVGPKVSWDIRELPGGAKKYINLGESMSTRAIAVGGQFGGGDRGEAARHAYWMAVITAKYGPDVAREVGISHEIGQEDTPDSMRDYYNNVLGRQIGLDVRGLPEDEQHEAIIKRIEEMMSSGELITDPSVLELSCCRCS